MDQSSPVADLKSSTSEFKKCTLVNLQWPLRLLDRLVFLNWMGVLISLLLCVHDYGALHTPPPCTQIVSLRTVIIVVTLKYHNQIPYSKLGNNFSIIYCPYCRCVCVHVCVADMYCESCIPFYPRTHMHTHTHTYTHTRTHSYTSQVQGGSCG